MARNMKEKAEKLAQNKDTRPKAIARYVRVSPSKVNRVLKIVRGVGYAEAVAILENTPNDASNTILSVLKSAGANAENNMSLSLTDLYIAEASANQGPTLKRMMPRAKGRGDRILKRTSHIQIILDVKEKE